jgi:AraC family transcriptional regulator
MSVQVHFYQDTALGFSRGHNSNMHAHLALQLTLGLEREFMVCRPDAAGELAKCSVRFDCFLPETMHHIPTSDIELAYLYLECSPLSFARWREAGGEVLEPDAALCKALLDYRRSRSSDRQHAFDLAQAWRAQSLPGLERIAPKHPRLAGVIEYLDAEPLREHSHITLAERANLSPSRFAHLFREQVGLPVRNYLLWRRLVYALSRLQQGHSITTAAYESGFSDGAHLCRSFRNVFGAMPTDLQVERVAVAAAPPRNAAIAI